MFKQNFYPDFEITAEIEDAETAYLYAKYLIKDRWPESEQVILDDLESSLSKKLDFYPEEFKYKNPVSIQYAENIIKDRWPDAENIILEYLPSTLKQYTAGQEIPRTIPIIYATDVIQDRWPDAEKIFLNPDQPNGAIAYSKYVIGNRWPELEQMLINKDKDRKYYLSKYINIMKLNKGDWPEAEKILNKSKKSSYD
jgi:hypothetical protein